MTETESPTKTEEVSVKKEEENSNGTAENDITQSEAEIIRQIEYYFGDMNLPRDKFLLSQVQLDSGWVPLTVLLTFRRLSKLTTDEAVITAALAKSTSGLLEISEDSKKVRRSPEVPLPELNEERRKEIQTRSVYVKGFPKDSTVDTCLDFFKNYPKVENVIMRRYRVNPSKEWHFKGSVFATFQTKEQAAKFLAEDGLKIGQTDAIKMAQTDYLKQKQEEYENRKQNNSKQKIVKEEKEEEAIALPVGAVIKFSGVTEEIRREDIKEVLTVLGAEVAFIDFSKGDKEGWVRLQQENSAKTLIEKCPEGKITINGNDVEIKLVEGDDEKEYIERTIAEIKKRRQANNFNKNKKKGNFQGGRGNKNFQGRKRKGQRHPDEPQRKVKTNDS